MTQDEDDNSLEAKFRRLFSNLKSIPSKIANAVDEGLQGADDLSCIKDGLLDFDLIEQDVVAMHTFLKRRGDVILGSHVIIDENSIEIQTFVTRQDKTFSVSTKSAVKLPANIPSGILEELKSNGKVELSVKL